MGCVYCTIGLSNIMIDLSLKVVFLIQFMGFPVCMYIIYMDDCCEIVFLCTRSALCSGVICSVVFRFGTRIWIIRRLSSGWISSSCLLHSQSLASCLARFRSTQLIRQDIGTQKSRDTNITVPTTLSFKNLSTDVMLISLNISMIRTIGSGLDFSHWPWWQKPW